MKKEEENVFVNTGIEDRVENLRNQADGEKFDESYFTDGRADWVVNCYFELDQYLLKKPSVTKKYKSRYISYFYKNSSICHISTGRLGEIINVWFNILYSDLTNPPIYFKDYTNKGNRYGVLAAFKYQRDYLDEREAIQRVLFETIDLSIKKVAGRHNYKVPKETIEKVKSPVLPKTKFTLTLEMDTAGWTTLKFKMYSVFVPDFLKKIM